MNNLELYQSWVKRRVRNAILHRYAETPENVLQRDDRMLSDTTKEICRRQGSPNYTILRQMLNTFALQSGIDRCELCQEYWKGVNAGLETMCMGGYDATESPRLCLGFKEDEKQTALMRGATAIRNAAIAEVREELDRCGKCSAIQDCSTCRMERE